MKRWSRGVAVPVALGLAVLAGGALVWALGGPGALWRGEAEAGPPAPEMTVELLDGTLVSLSELRGRVVLLNFWATWCPPCRLEMPGFQDVWEDYRDRGVVILGLSVDRGDRGMVERWVRDRDITYPIAFPTGAVVRAYGGANVLPTSLLINREGRIVRRVEGFYAEPTLRGALNRLLE